MNEYVIHTFFNSMSVEFEMFADDVLPFVTVHLLRAAVFC